MVNDKYTYIYRCYRLYIYRYAMCIEHTCTRLTLQNTDCMLASMKKMYVNIHIITTMEYCHTNKNIVSRE